MVTKEELKKEVDRLPENLVEEVYALLKRVIQKGKEGVDTNSWAKWKHSLDKFTTDFMDSREQNSHEIRESLD
jgi:hypothetical protein